MSSAGFTITKQRILFNSFQNITMRNSEIYRSFSTDTDKRKSSNRKGGFMAEMVGSLQGPFQNSGMMNHLPLDL